MTPEADSEGAAHWEAYWRAPDAGAAVSGDAPGDLFDSLWRQFFREELAARDSALLLDIACGAGVVLDRSADYAHETQCRMRLVGVDYSAAAALAVHNKPPVSGARIAGVAASAEALPFRDHAFDLVVSQFGIEYAGIDAFGEASRALAPGGAGFFVIHYKDGGIDRECRANFVVLEAIESSGLFEAALDGLGAPAESAPDRRIAAIAASLAPHLAGEPLAAKQLLARLAPDVSRLVARRAAYDPQEAQAWLFAMRNEIKLYAARMNAMIKAALDDAGVKAAGQKLSAGGVAVDEPQRLYAAGKSLPAAWRISFRRKK